MPLKFRNKLCTACHLCELICSATHVDEFAPSRSRIRIENSPQEGFSKVMACFSCPDAPCIASCPTGAISRPGSRQPLVIDHQVCDGCGGQPACVPACPYGAMYFDAVVQRAIACDMCGGDPQCVKYCYSGAILTANSGSAAKANETAEDHERSQALYQRAARVMPLGVSSNFRYWGDKETLVVERASGAYIWDVDGHRYIDYRLGFGPMILGHAYQAVDDRVRQAVGEGVVYALTNQREIRVAEKLVAVCPCVEMVRFANSGTEATMHALRLARAYTDREKVIKFEGQYHGMYDYMLFSTYAPPSTFGGRYSPVPVAASSGIPKSIHELVITLPFNDFEVLERVLRHTWFDVAAIIVEPIMGNCASIEPLPGWLEFIRAKCMEYGIVMIMDEVKTGFRVARGGAQELYGIEPDLATYAKAMGNGYPVAAFGGKRAIMNLIGRGVAHGGTYTSNVVGMAAAEAVLDILEDGEVLDTIAQRGRLLQEGLKRIFKDAGIPLRLTGHPAMVGVNLTEDLITDSRAWAKTDHALYERIMAACVKRGVMPDIDPREPWFLSYSHSEADINETLNVVEDAIREVKS